MYDPAANDNENLASALAVTPLVVPLIKTDACASFLPAPSVMDPVTTVCANTLLPESKPRETINR